jgi:hypothetical protein
MFQCTFPMCAYSSESQVDWKRHEEKESHWPQQRFMCLQCNIPSIDLEGNPVCSFCSVPFSTFDSARTHYLYCMSARESGRTFGRKDHLCKHLEVEHGQKNMVESTKAWSFPVLSNWPRECGYCGIFVNTWDRRMVHIGKHYQQGVQKSSWILPFPRTKDQNFNGLSSLPEHEDDDDDDQHDDRSHDKNYFAAGYDPAYSSQQVNVQSQQNYEDNQLNYDLNYFNRCAPAFWKSIRCKTRGGFAAFPLFWLVETQIEKSSRGYVNKCKHHLSEGVWWFEMDLEHGIESSLWSLALRAVQTPQSKDLTAFQLLFSLRQKTSPIPRTLYSPTIRVGRHLILSRPVNEAIVGSPSTKHSGQFNTLHQETSTSVRSLKVQNGNVDKPSTRMSSV